MTLKRACSRYPKSEVPRGNKTLAQVGRIFGLARGAGVNDEDLPQSADISDKDLDVILDRRDLLGLIPPNPCSGVGWEDAEDRSGMSLLGNISDANAK